MRQIRNYGDQRISDHVCAYCGQYADTRDHVPSKVFLNEPYPLELPVVWACEKCNNSFSLDEAYLACVIDLASNSGETKREKTKKILDKTPLLKAKIEQRISVTASGVIVIQAESHRVRNIILKLARGHVLFEINELLLHEPDHISFVPIHLLSPNDRNQFESCSEPDIFPEVGSRAMQRVFSEPLGWIIVQNELYRYNVSWSGDITVKIVIGDYLACQATWK